MPLWSQLRWHSPILSKAVCTCPEFPQLSLLVQVLAKQELAASRERLAEVMWGEAHTFHLGLTHHSKVPVLIAPVPTLANVAREPPGHMWLCLTL